MAPRRRQDGSTAILRGRADPNTQGAVLTSDEFRALALRGLSEKQFMALIVSRARALGYRAYHTFNSRRSAPGFPDLVLCRPPGPVFFVEVKVKQNKLSGPQIDWLGALERCEGVEALAVWPDDWPVLERILEGRGPADATAIRIEEE